MPYSRRSREMRRSKPRGPSCDCTSSTGQGGTASARFASWYFSPPERRSDARHDAGQGTVIRGPGGAPAATTLTRSSRCARRSSPSGGPSHRRLPRRRSSRDASWCGEKRVNYLRDRKSTRLNSSHLVISYAVFCLKKKKINTYLIE